MENQEKVWDKIAELWAGYREQPLPEVIKFLKNKKGNILDLGCGSGRNFIPLNAEVYGADFSKKLLKIAEEKAKKIKTKIILQKASADSLPFQTNFFDSAIFIRTLHCIDSEEKRENSLKELFRVLKPGAEALIETWSKNQERVRNKPKECFIPWTIKKNKIQRYTYLYDKKELKSQLEKIGFKIKKISENQNIEVIVEK